MIIAPALSARKNISVILSAALVGTIARGAEAQMAAIVSPSALAIPAAFSAVSIRAGVAPGAALIPISPMNSYAPSASVPFAPALAPALAPAAMPSQAAAALPAFAAAASVPENPTSAQVLGAREAGLRQFDSAPSRATDRGAVPEWAKTGSMDYVLNGLPGRKKVILPGDASPFSVQGAIRRGLESLYANRDRAAYYHVDKDEAGNVIAQWANEALRCGDQCEISSGPNWGKSMSPAGALFGALDEAYRVKPLMMKMDRSETRPTVRESSASELDVISLEDSNYRIVAERLETVSIYEGFARHGFRVSIYHREGSKWIPLLGDAAN